MHDESHESEQTQFCIFGIKTSVNLLTWKPSCLHCSHASLISLGTVCFQSTPLSQRHCKSILACMRVGANQPTKSIKSLGCVDSCIFEIVTSINLLTQEHSCFHCNDASLISSDTVWSLSTFLSQRHCKSILAGMRVGANQPIAPKVLAMSESSTLSWQFWVLHKVCWLASNILWTIS